MTGVPPRLQANVRHCCAFWMTAIPPLPAATAWMRAARRGQAYRDRAPAQGRSRPGSAPRHHRMICEQRNSDNLRPFPSTTVADHTWVERPRCSATASTLSTPSFAVPRKLDFSSSVVKPLAPRADAPASRSPRRYPPAIPAWPQVAVGRHHPWGEGHFHGHASVRDSQRPQAKVSGSVPRWRSNRLSTVSVLRGMKRAPWIEAYVNGLPHSAAQRYCWTAGQPWRARRRRRPISRRHAARGW